MDDRGPRTPEGVPPLPIVRHALLALGWVFVAVGVVGLVVPLLPGVVFLILAAACFARSSPRFERWLLTHPRLGPPVRAWRATGAIPRRAKRLAYASLAVSWLVLFPAGAPTIAKVGCLVIFVGVGLFIGTRPHG